MGWGAKKRQTVGDYWIEHAIREVKRNYGHNVSVNRKAKSLNKIGRHKAVGNTTETTIMTLPTGVLRETYVDDNSITTAVSANAGDTQTIILEGHTVSGIDKTFLRQSVTLNGQTPVALTTPLNRATMSYNISNTSLVGPVYICENDTFTAGVPDTPTGVHLMMDAGKQRSEKGGTSLSSIDYFFATRWTSDFLAKTAGYASLRLLSRKPDGVFIFEDVQACSDAKEGFEPYGPYLIFTPNNDIEIVGTSDSAGGRDVESVLSGVFAKII